MAKELDAKLLAGLTFKGTKAEEVKTEAGKKTKHVPFTRPLEAADVLDWKDNGATVTIVTTDGKKHVVKKGKSREA